MKIIILNKFSRAIILLIIGYCFPILSANAINNNTYLYRTVSSINIEEQSFLVDFVISDYNGFEISFPGASDGFINITVSGGVSPYSFLWSTGDISEDLYGLSEGAYSLCVFDGSGLMVSTIFELNPPEIQILELNSGWSMISSFICPLNLSIVDLFSPVVTNLVSVKDGSGNVYWPQYGVNMIGIYTASEGYYIKMLNSDDLTIYGSILEPENLMINLPVDWSILGYPRTDPGNIVDMLLPIVNDIDIVKNTLGMIYWPSLNFDMIGNMVPGEGYQIKMLSASSFTFPMNDNSSPIVTCPQTVTDFDGNTYEVVLVGNNCWMAENLRVTHFSDGIPLVNGAGVGNISTDYLTKYYFDYNDNSSNTSEYGKLYNWASMLNGAECGNLLGTTQGVCPTGWHVPNESDWNDLMGNVDSQYNVGDVEWEGSGYLGSDIGGNLKETGSLHWNSPNVGAADTHGFSALPAGYRMSTGTSLNLGANSYFWSSQANCSFYGMYRKLSYSNTTVYKDIINKTSALSIRCVKDN